MILENNCIFFENGISIAIQRIPTNSCILVDDEYDISKTFNGEKSIFSLDIRCIRRGNTQLSLFNEDNNIKLSDSSKKIFIALLRELYVYYNAYGKDVENLVIRLTPKIIAPFLAIKFSSDASAKKNQMKEIRMAIRKFKTELSDIRVVSKYSYFDEKGKKVNIEFDGGIFDTSTSVRKTDEKGNVLYEGFPVNPRFYYSLVNCNYVMQVPFTLFAIMGKNSFSILFDLYAHSRECSGTQKIKVMTLLSHLGFENRVNKPRFRQDTRNRIVDILRNSVGLAITPNFKFVSSGGVILDVDECSNDEWVQSTLVWEQLVPSKVRQQKVLK